MSLGVYNTGVIGAAGALQRAIGPPTTAMFWIRIDNIEAGDNWTFCRYITSSNFMRFGFTSGGRVVANQNGGGTLRATTSNSASAGLKWWHMAATWTNNSLRESFLDGDIANRGTSTAFTSTTTTAESIALGNQSLGSNSNNPNGEIAHAAIWDCVLSYEEIIALSKGVYPHAIRPESLAYYWPCTDQPAWIQSSQTQHRLVLPINQTGVAFVNDGPPMVEPIIRHRVWIVPAAISAFTMTAAQTLGQITQAGSVAEEFTLTAAQTLGEATQAGVISETFDFTGAMTTGEATQAASVLLEFSLTGAMTVDEATQAGSLNVVTPAASITSAMTLGEATQVGSLSLEFILTSAMNMSEATQAGVLSQSFDMTSAMTVDEATQAGSMLLTFDMTSAMTVDEATQAGSLTEVFSMTSAMTVDEVTQLGALGDLRTMSGAMTVEEVTQAGTFAETFAMTSAMNVDEATQAGVLGDVFILNGAMTLDEVSSGGGGELVITANGEYIIRWRRARRS